MLSILLASFSRASEVLFSRFGIVTFGIDSRKLTTGIFLHLALFVVVAFLLLGWIDGYGISFQKRDIALLCGVTAAGFASNLLYTYGIRNKTITTLENSVIILPALTIFLAWVLGAEKINPAIAALVIFSTGLLLWSDQDSQQPFTLDDGTLLVIGALVFSALESIFAAMVLSRGGYTPLSLYMIRTLAIAGMFSFLIPINLSKIGSKNRRFMAIAALFGLCSSVFKFYALRDLGIVETAILLLLIPVIVSVLTSILLRQPMRKREKLVNISIASTSIFLATVNPLFFQ